MKTGKFVHDDALIECPHCYCVQEVGGELGKIWCIYCATPFKVGARDNNYASVAAIQYALETDEGLEFLRLWNEGDFDAIRDEWEDVPDDVFIGADPLFKPKG